MINLDGLKNEAGIYCIINIINEKKYIGRSKNIKKRISYHIPEDKNNG